MNNQDKGDCAIDQLAPSWESLCELVGFIADSSWEMDQQFQITRIAGDELESIFEYPLSSYIGRGFECLGIQPLVAEKRKHSLTDILKAKQRFPFVDCYIQHDDGQRYYLRVAASAIVDEHGQYRGYRGLICKISAKEAQQRESIRFREIADASPDCIFLSNAETFKFEYVNDRAVELSGIPREQLLHIYGHQLTGRTFEEMSEIFRKTITSGKAGYTEPIHFATSVDGKKRGWFEPNHRALIIDGTQYIVTISREVTPQILAEKSVERSKRIYAALTATIDTVMRARDESDLFSGVCNALISHGRLDSASIMLANQELDTLDTVAAAGASKEELATMSVSTAIDQPGGIGLNALALRSRRNCVSNDFMHDSRAQIWRDHAERFSLRSGAAVPLNRGNRCIGTLFLCAHERRVFDDEVISLLEKVAENVVYGIYSIEQQREKYKAEQRVLHLATHDELTGLPNRSLFGELLDQEIANTKRYRSQLAVMFIDLDGFKQVNDFLGHAAGDSLLQEIAKRFRASLRESDVIARLGGDEFVILLHSVNDVVSASVVAKKILEVSRIPIEVNGQTCHVSSSVGISIYPAHGVNRTELMQSADAAMYLAKAKGKNTFEYFISTDES